MTRGPTRCSDYVTGPLLTPDPDSSAGRFAHRHTLGPPVIAVSSFFMFWTRVERFEHSVSLGGAKVSIRG
ncbi:hypothetical protein E2C01_090063 [Portunus trituberculatus]|uniref:Uncharacterized protein n=1 Tax=Portunus trituberculatus TaxID=210409 RepID=A0A5B7JR87_PORTR|nr:hypothetical protein [Portunus trituberculatus]